MVVVVVAVVVVVVVVVVEVVVVEVVVVVGEAGGQDGAKMFCIAWSWNKNYRAYMELLFGIYGRCFLAVGDILWAYFSLLGRFDGGIFDIQGL